MFVKRALQVLVALGALVCAAPAACAQAQHRFEVGEGCFLLDGKPFIIKAAEMLLHRLRLHQQTSLTISNRLYLTIRLRR